jgi:hypothetical protein
VSLIGVGGGAGMGAEDLDRLVGSGAERFEAALAGGGVAAGAEMALRVESARRDTSNRYRAWMALTEGYLFESGGHGRRVAAARRERTAELALRSGFDLESLALAGEVSAGPVNPISEGVTAAARRGDGEGLREAFGRGDELLRRIHDFYCDLLSDQLGAIYREEGPEGLEAAMLYAAARGAWKTTMPADLALEPNRRLRELAFFLTVCAHFRIKITDEGERWRIDVLECGRCGRQCRDRYTDPDWGLEVVRERGPLTFGRPPMTIYQAHLAVIHHQFAIDEFGAPWPVFDCRGFREDAGGCRMLVYKDPWDAPAEVFAAVGREKPAWGGPPEGAGG